MEIIGMKVLMPAVVKYRKDSGIEDVVSCYFDPTTGEVTITEDLVDNKDCLQKLISEHVVSKRKNSIIPPTPSEGFTKLKPETYTNNPKE